MASRESSIQRFPCAQCGAEAAFHPQSGKLKCEYCGWESALAAPTKSVQEHSYEQYFTTNRTRLAALSTTALEVDCHNCGARITYEPPQVAGQCPFCAAAIVAQPKLADPTLAPDGIVPFAIARREARKCLQDWMGSRWFAPNRLKQLAQPEKIHGVYLPFLTYDAQTQSDYRGERGEYYYVTETYTETNSAGQTETKTREVRHTRWYPVSGRVSRFFDDVLVAATTSMDAASLQALGPWDLQKSLQPYEPSYLAGFEAQRAQISLKEGFGQAKSLMEGAIYSDVRSAIGGDEQRVTEVSTTYQDITFKPILLPVWLASYRYNNRQYQVLINARTGAVRGDRPYSVVKITLAVLGGLLLVAAIAGLVLYLRR